MTTRPAPMADEELEAIRQRCADYDINGVAADELPWAEACAVDRTALLAEVDRLRAEQGRK